MLLKAKDCCDQIRGVSYKPSDVVEKDKGIPLLRANNICDGSIIYDDLVYVKKEKVSPAQFLRNGDVLICASSGSKSLVGKAAVYKGTDGVYTFGAFCKVMRPRQGFDNNFIAFFFDSKKYREEISAKSHGANINNIKADDLDSMSFSYYEDLKNQVVVKVLTKLITLISIKKNQLNELNSLVKSRFVGG